MNADRARLAPGSVVRYEVSKRDGSSFPVRAVVLEDRGRRVLIQYEHWHDGRTIQSRVQPHRITGAGL